MKIWLDNDVVQISDDTLETFLSYIKNNSKKVSDRGGAEAPKKVFPYKMIILV